MNRQQYPFTRRTVRGHQSGFSLVEILVGVAIALIGMIMMFQLMENWEVRKRTTSAGSDAQISGSVASYRLTQDVKQGGYGFGTANANLGCTVAAYDGSPTRADPNFEFRLIPVRIIDGAAGAPDEVHVLYGNSSSFSANFRYAETTTFTKKTKTEGPRTGLHRGDVVIVAPDSAACGMMQITANTGTGAEAYTVEHRSQTYTFEESGLTAPLARYNDPAGYLGTPTGIGSLYNLGDKPRQDRWRVRGRILQACNHLEVDCEDPDQPWDDIAEGVVDLQAEYGLDTNDDHVIDRWQSGDPAAWAQVRAIRVAILARSQHYEKSAVTSQPLGTGWLDASDDPVLFSMRDVDGNVPSSDGSANDWHHYRYRVYTTTIPLRNVVWGMMPGVAP